MCGACVSDCTVLEVDKSFLGPAALAKAWRFVGDPRDDAELSRLRELSEPSGMWDCTRCNMCVNVCPKDVKPMDQILKLRAVTTHDKVVDNHGTRHTMAFMNLIGGEPSLFQKLTGAKPVGRLDEFRLPVLTHGTFNLVGQISDLPIAVRMIRSGKMPSPFPHKISGIKHVKNIFKRFEHSSPKAAPMMKGH
jgi:succinate dehydrogenase / fumarate reductase iron-sulfur subunit